MEYEIIIAIVALSVVVALYFNRRYVQLTFDETDEKLWENTLEDGLDEIPFEDEEDVTLLSTWTKKGLQEYSLTKYSTKLPNSMKKQDMIDSIVNMSNEV